MQRLVLGYDGSPAAVAALDWTAARCARSLARVDVINVASSLTRDRAESVQRLAEAEAVLRARAPGVLLGLHRLEGTMPEALVDFARDADLAVIGLRPGHPVRAAAQDRALPRALESVAPVCMVPAGWTEKAGPVTVGITGDRSSDAAASFAAREARAMSTSVRLVHAWLMPAPRAVGSMAPAVDPAAEFRRHRALLDEAVARLVDEHPTLAVSDDLVRESRAAALVSSSARSSMLVIGTHREGAGLELGSVAEDVLSRARCPVCIVSGGAASRSR